MRRNNLYGYEQREPDLRRRPRMRRSYNLKQMWQRSHEIALLSLQGYKGTEIAKILNISEATVSNTLNSELVENKLSELREQRDKDGVDVAKRVNELMGPALDVYEGLLKDEDAPPRLRKDVADTVLMEIGGHRAPTKTVSGHIHATSDELEEFFNRGRQASEQAGIPIEAREVKAEEG